MKRYMTVIQCSYAGADEACGLSLGNGPLYDNHGPQVFGDDASYDECHHNWSLAVAEEVARRWNAEEDKYRRIERRFRAVQVPRVLVAE